MLIKINAEEQLKNVTQTFVNLMKQGFVNLLKQGLSYENILEAN